MTDPQRATDARDLEADVVIVGFGAAGACAALEAAAAGADVLVLDRFGGGGATALSGGIVYAGGGTRPQGEAGVADTVDAMASYLSLEVGEAVSAATLREFCAGSAAMIDWLAGHGVPFEGSLCPEKTSYPTNRHYLYYSGSELSFRQVAEPAPRGHRAVGRGTSGQVLYTALAGAARSAGVRVVLQSQAVAPVTDGAGRVTGMDCRSMRSAPAPARAAHRILSGWAASRTCTRADWAAGSISRSPGWSGGTPARCGYAPGGAWCSRREGSWRTGP